MNGLEGDWTEVREEIRRVSRDIRHSIPPSRLDLGSLAALNVRTGFLHGRRIERVVCILKSNGCKWARDEEGAGGCAMCGHLAGTSRGHTIPPAVFVQQFESLMRNQDFVRYPMLCLYNSGSFLNPDELPASARTSILQMIAENEDIEHVIIESRPEFFNREVLEDIATIMKGKTVEIGVGLETSDPTLRNSVLNKGVENNELGELRNVLLPFTNVKLLFYILVKPPFVSEGFALDNAVDSVNYAYNIGADVVSLEPVSVQDFTIVDLLSRAGHFRPPWIWTVIEVVRRTFRKDKTLRMGGFEFYPVPKEFVRNCNRCNTRFVKAIDRYNSINSLDVFDGMDCKCRVEEWESAVCDTSPPTPSGVMDILKTIDVAHVIEEMKASFKTT